MERKKVELEKTIFNVLEGEVPMSAQSQQVLASALDLPPMERAELVEGLLASFEFPSRQQIDSLWAREAEDRIDAYEQSKIKATPASRVFDKIDKQLS